MVRPMTHVLMARCARGDRAAADTLGWMFVLHLAFFVIVALLAAGNPAVINNGDSATKNTKVGGLSRSTSAVSTAHASTDQASFRIPNKRRSDLMRKSPHHDSTSRSAACGDEDAPDSNLDVHEDGVRCKSDGDSDLESTIVIPASKDA